MAIRELNLDRPAEALGWLDRAVGLVESDPHWSGGSFRSSIEDQRAKALDRLGRPTEAAAARDKSRACGRAAPAEPAPLSTTGPTPTNG